MAASEARATPGGTVAGRHYRLEDQVGHLLRRAHQRASVLFLGHFGAARLTPTQFAALARLYDAGEVSQNRLGRLTAMDPATIQGVIRRLAERALIADRPDPRDRRRTLLRLTTAGRALVVGLLGAGFAVSDETLAPLSAAERETFLGLLRRLG